jgi:uncharacterized protein YdhG (YjbR/CyaY superfamily)
MTIIDDYLQKIEPTKRKQLVRIRKIAKQVIPEAKETISYRMPTLKYKGKAFLGFNAHANHLGIYPYGGQEIEVLKDELSRYEYGFSAGAIRVPYDKPFPESLLKQIIRKRIRRITV